MGQLKSCPFCGGGAKLSNAECGLDGFPSSYRQPCCTNCGARMGYMLAPQAIAEWNRRADLDDAAATLIEDLRKTLKPFAEDADEWHDSVPDDHRPLCTEPGSKTAHPGSETKFTVGDLRRARSALTSKAST